MTIGYFDGVEYDIIDKYKEEKTNPFFEYKKVLSGKLSDSNMLVPLLNWFSNNIKNISSIQALNKNFFWVDKEILNRGLALGINRSVRFIKYPKKIKNEPELAFLIPYIQRYYNWSDREWEHYKHLINLEDTEMHQELHKMFALEKKEYRKLGIKNKKIKVKYNGKPKIVGFF